MTLPASRRRWPERWRPAFPSDVWDPMGMAHLWDRMNRMFGEQVPGMGPEGGWIPAVETEEAGDAYMVRAELPGMKSEDVHVELNGNELRITGEVEEEDGGGKTKTLRQRHGKFAYRTSLPSDADADRANAELTDGVLTVRLPKAPQARARQIAIQPR